jgi:hypothetical protein
MLVVQSLHIIGELHTALRRDEVGPSYQMKSMLMTAADD